jgi:hypothetical protein
MGAVYKGWIPTVVGRLSFRSIGSISFPDRHIYRNIAFSHSTGRQRFIISYQRRKLSDGIFPLITGPLLGESGEFFFVLSASTNISTTPYASRLTGTIFAFIKPTWSRARQKLREFIADDRASITFSEFDLELRRRNADLMSQSDFHVNFELERNGFVQFSIPTVNNNSILDQNEENERNIVNHCYFFLRDMCHKHQHHNPRSDTLLTVLKVEDEAEDNTWKRHILYSLLYHVVQYKRRAKSQVQAQARGIISYTRTFERLAHLEDSSLFLEELDSSILSKESEISAIQNTRAAARSFAFSILFSVFAILVATTNLVAIQLASNSTVLKLSPQAIAITKFLVENIHLFFGLIVIGLIYAFLVAVKDRIFNTGIARDLSRIVIIATPSVFMFHTRGITWNMYLVLGIALLLISLYFATLAF